MKDTGHISSESSSSGTPLKKTETGHIQMLIHDSLNPQNGSCFDTNDAYEAGSQCQFHALVLSIFTNIYTRRDKRHPPWSYNKQPLPIKREQTTDDRFEPT